MHAQSIAMYFVSFRGFPHVTLWGYIISLLESHFANFKSYFHLGFSARVVTTDHLSDILQYYRCKV